MSEPVNLNRFRKAKAKSAAKTQASENRVKFGLTKAQKKLEAALRDKAASNLDSAKRDPD
ncbi:hypothetical protein QO010_000045 [Caulobacter ginsengisoli]|uniref:DUF4169 domain-containing protein n=1 Tax=Caulobacter ginsengisoli TaxID=400775 RepID=A0ABU0IJW4_9CAUL|nr:DUF4169 family protein [Caulobacter ginsengisoli]MDQ0462297.1 hypothetical protein [Caulobacter ginsengisoli]